MNTFMAKSHLKAVRGWTDRAITTLLGECDYRKPNPFYTNGSPVQFFDAERVLQAEATEEFKRIRDARARRSEAAKAAKTAKIAMTSQNQGWF